ncbi:MAG TPA: DHH family phosphoesterase [Phycisphaerales bacterium]|nr:DHH family phosphoesterase [Phycisphaerales bacterium]
MSTRPAQAPWGTNAALAEIADRLRGAGAVVIVTHSKPDGDAAGSTLGVLRALLRLGVPAQAWYAGPRPRWIGALAGSSPVRYLAASPPMTPAEGAPFSGSELAPAAVLVMDTGSWSQLGEYRPWLATMRGRAIVIDHHLHGDADVAEVRLVDPSVPAVAQLAARLCCELLGAAGPADLPAEVAEPLYLGLATDTGWFRHSNLTAEAMHLAADLLDAGADHTRLYQTVEQQDSPGRLRLMARALASLELHAGDSIALMLLRRSDFAQCRAERTDSGGLVDLPLAVATVRASAVLTEEAADPDGRPVTKASLRSKPGPDAVDVNQVSRTLGGGGHARAAGVKLNLPPDEARAAILRALGAVP